MSPNSSSTRKLVLLLGAVALLVSSFILGAPRTAAALPSQSCDCDYYSDASHSTEVGERYVFCNGQIYRWGVTSPYVDCYCEDC
jgi:hypothetical protein